MTVGFQDHFSKQSDGYAKYRPTYPPELFEFLAAEAAGHEVAWDCATGSGQAAVALGDHFASVIATDASQAQIDAAGSHPGVEYRVATAEESGLQDQSVDLVAVGQAFHWFDAEAFMAESSRVLRSNGVLAIWCYELCSVSDACDAIVDELYRDIVGEFWPPERVTIEQGYSEVIMPGAALKTPSLAMSSNWRVSDMLGYLRTWSASKRFETAKATDPVAQVEAALISAWGDGPRSVSWPLAIKACRPNSLLE